MKWFLEWLFAAVLFIVVWATFVAFAHWDLSVYDLSAWLPLNRGFLVAGTVIVASIWTGFICEGCREPVIVSRLTALVPKRKPKPRKQTLEEALVEMERLEARINKLKVSR